MQKEAGAGRISFQLMGNTQDQQSFSLLHGLILRTVSFQALPACILKMRNFLIFAGLIMIFADGVDCYLYKQVTLNYMAMMGPGVMPFTGLERDWLAFCFLGSLCSFFGTLWLYKEMLLAGFAIQLCILPPMTSGIIYLNYAYDNQFYTWWYFSVCIFQFFVGLCTMYLYAWLKKDMEAREREEHIKADMGKIEFPRACFSIVAMPCQHKLWDANKYLVIRRYNNMHELDVRANILCPVCKNRIDYICE